MSQPEYEQIFNAWVALHRQTWFKFEANPQNKVTLIAAAQHYRPCFVAFDRAFVDSQAQLVRSDGHDDAWDREQLVQRKASQDAALEASTVVDADFISYVMSLSQAQIAEAYYADPTSEFARKYRVLIREHGFQLAPKPTRRGV